MRLSFIKRPRFFLPTLIVLGAITATILSIHNLNAPAVGTVTAPPPTKLDKVDTSSHPNNYDGKYISFTYPAHYRTISNPPTGNYIETASFYATNQTSKQISVGIVKESIGDDGGVKLRRMEIGKYKEEPRTASGILIFSSTTDGSERTAFVPHADKVASISVTAPPGWDLTNDLETILTSLQWK
jgi:hypothetical protein